MALAGGAVSAGFAPGNGAGGSLSSARAAAPAAVRYITVQFTVVRGGTNMSFRATVNPRNLL